MHRLLWIRSSTPIPTSSAICLSAAIRSKVLSAVDATNCVAPAALARSMDARSRMLHATLAWIGPPGLRMDLRPLELAPRSAATPPAEPDVDGGRAGVERRR